MNNENPILALHEALSAALLRDLPDIHYTARDWLKWRALPPDLRQKKRVDDPEYTIAMKRRPEARDVEVELFLQTWGSTALGYGGIGGAAMTSAYTVIVTDAHSRKSCVYFGYGKLAYTVDLTATDSVKVEAWHKDRAARHIASAHDAKERYPIELNATNGDTEEWDL